MLSNLRLVCLMPTYNKETTLAKAIESVIMQKTDFDYKLIILDDCSVDNSNKIANEYKEKYPEKIQIIKNEKNLGLLKTITNAYYSLKNVDYFCVLDADDWYIYDKKFSDAVDFLDKHKDFSIYMSNITLLQNEEEKQYFVTDKNTIDYCWSDYKKGKMPHIQTSGVVYRNIYFKDGMNEQFLNGTKEPYGELMRADGFRTVWHLKSGKAHFVNRFESVYNYNDNGIWASLTSFEQSLLNAKLSLALSEILTDEQSYFLNQMKRLYDTAIEGFRKNDERYINKNKDLIFYMYSKTYLSKNPIFDNKSVRVKKRVLKSLFNKILRPS